ncbi:MAG TPA: lysylphosphatidylglycerol synthase transmembrane domain-containing protein, partial [Actinotalea sp.]|nr:lysylphosphatidylglycerol synthase transmembrane domain-containing protein [Actinotalea sp.]
ATPLADLDDEALTDEVLADAWAQLRLAHAAGLAHRDLTADVLLVRDARVWIVGWTNGDIASTELARRLDLAQMLAVLALRVGVPRAVGSAAQVLNPELLGAIAPLLQPVALPQQTRVLARQHKGLLDDVRAALIELMPTAADVEPVQLARFSARTVVTTTIAVVAVWLVLSSLNIRQLTEALKEANPMWAAVAFALGLLTYVGAALSMVAFSPVHLTLWRTTLVQAAASVVALVTPAGVGPAALNLRYLNRRKVETPLAVASVALIQVSQFVTTIVLLLLIAALTGTSGAFQVPGAAAFVVMGVIAAGVAVALLVPSIRRWIWTRSAPTLRQVWPRVLWVVGQPGRLGLGLLGNVIMTGGFIAAFAASLAAFGQQVPPTQLAIIYLGGTALGSAVPTPGGLGTVELALSGGLTAAGIPAAVAASVAVLFRLLTFWARIPVGWVAMRYLQRKNDL